jgi:hypothetical protein
MHVVCNIIEVLPYVKEILRYCYMWHMLRERKVLPYGSENRLSPLRHATSV